MNDLVKNLIGLELRIEKGIPIPDPRPNKNLKPTTKKYKFDFYGMEIGDYIDTITYSKKNVRAMNCTFNYQCRINGANRMSVAKNINGIIRIWRLT